MAPALSRPTAATKPRLADPHYRLSHAGACLRGIEQGDPAKARRVDEGTGGKGTIVITPDASLRPGTRLVREWRGRTHTVVVTEDGFRIRRQSLSIADQDRACHHWGPLVRPALLRLDPQACIKWPIGLGCGWDRSVRRWPMANRSAPGSHRAPGKTSLRDLYPQEQRGRAGTGLQLARRPARSLRGLHRQPEARRMGPYRRDV